MVLKLESLTFTSWKDTSLTKTVKIKKNFISELLLPKTIL
jgi:hypothetical protein